MNQTVIVSFILVIATLFIEQALAGVIVIFVRVPPALEIVAA
jgi:hypothetical protein